MKWSSGYFKDSLKEKKKIGNVFRHEIQLNLVDI